MELWKKEVEKGVREKTGEKIECQTVSFNLFLSWNFFPVVFVGDGKGGNLYAGRKDRFSGVWFF